MNLDMVQGVWAGGVYFDIAPYTTHTFTIPANLPIKTAAYATWRVIWSAPSPAPGYETGIVRLFTRTPDTSGPKVPIAWVLSSTMLNPGANNISNDALDVTVSFNNFLFAHNYGHLGWDISGDGSTPLKIWNSRLEIGWNVQ
ncbi:MAG TPA: hypothetical protein VGO52_08200 [Hyphomonadaceae bacterium]|jgi:hypothetical protein|nr:hypothetical protein [Hyphomonadaceae bacterium]